MDWLQSNWVWFTVVVGFIAMHFFGHGGHSHGRSSHGGGHQEPDTGGTSGAKTAHGRSQDGPQTHTGHELAPASSCPVSMPRLQMRRQAHRVAMSDRSGRGTFQTENAVEASMGFTVG